MSLPHHLKVFEDSLKALTEKGLIRHLSSFEGQNQLTLCDFVPKMCDFCSNDYLGLRHHPVLADACAKAAMEYGTGSGASRLMSGNYPLFESLEYETALFKGTQSCLVFGSGYAANTGVFAAILKAGDAVFADELCHASIVDGILLSKARLFRFRHNDLNHLEMLLKGDSQPRQKRIIVAETLYSMDGDQADIAGLIRLKEQFDTLLVLDEAHAFGVFGQEGEGLVRREAAQEVDIQVVTYGKALGGYGAAVLCDKPIREYLVNISRPFIFSTALPPPVLATNLAALRLLKSLDRERHDVIRLSAILREELANEQVETIGNSQIVPVLIGKNSRAVKLADYLFQHGFYVKAIRPPTVPENTARLRFSITALHQEQEIENLVKHIAHGLANIK